MKKRWQLDEAGSWSSDGYWASYSDLMAGVLLVLAIAAAAAWYEVRQTIIEPTEPVRVFQQAAAKICEDPRLPREGAVHVSCETGVLTISEEALRYARNETDLNDDGRQLLLDVVPQYLEVVRTHLGEGSLEISRIEVSGHTDSTGTYNDNVVISSERARKVLGFLAGDNVNVPLNPFQELFQEKGVAAGYAFSIPPNDRSSPPQDWPEARRIEIRVEINSVAIFAELMGMLDSLGLLDETR